MPVQDPLPHTGMTTPSGARVVRVVCVSRHRLNGAFHATVAVEGAKANTVKGNCFAISLESLQGFDARQAAMTVARLRDAWGLRLRAGGPKSRATFRHFIRMDALALRFLFNRPRKFFGPSHYGHQPELKG